MNELEKCMAGEWYDCHDGIFLDYKNNARNLLAKYNSFTYEQKQEKTEVLQQLFGSMGTNVSVGLPFLCDYGKNIHIGTNVSINMNCTFVDCNKIEIGNNVLIASNVQIYTATHPVELLERLTPDWDPESGEYFCRTYALPVKIGSGCWIGGGVIILPGVTIGDGTVIGAGSVVTKDIPVNSVAVGNPCRVIRKINEGECEMKRRRLGKTDLCVSEIGFGGEWLERHPEEEGIELIKYASSKGINILDCWMPDPKSRNIIGEAIKENRGEWYIQGHIGSTWKDEQYYRTREMEYVRPAFEDLLARLQTDYIDLGMIHYVDSEAEWEQIQDSDYLKYVMSLKESGVIRHIGMSSHNPKVAIKAAQSGYVEMILFSINPAFDMLPASENIDDMFAEEFDAKLKGIDPERALLYQTCEQNDVGITVMKGFAGGRLFSEKSSPFGVSLTPVQCIHYALTRPAVCSILCGYDTKEQVDAAVSYETATDDEKDYASVIASAPLHSYKGQCTYCGHCRPCPKDIDIAMVNKFYDLAVMQSEVPESVQSHYELLEHHASECIGCKGCESRCPFSVEIAERMRKTAELFGK